MVVGDVETGSGCFDRHLREAISLNQRRAELYSSWTDGDSEPVSRRLIRAERAARVVAWHVDRRARPFQEAGIPIACAEFVSMSLTPPLGSRPGPTPPGRYPSAPDPDSVIDAITAAYGAGGFPRVAATADGILAAMATAPAYHCMVRHLVESVWRVAALAPEHAAAARAAGLSSTRPLSELLLRLQLAALPEGSQLDRQAAPLQRAGVPIICRDAPPIHTAP